MAFVPIRRARLNQPSGDGIDWSNPLTRGLVDVIDCSAMPTSMLLRTPAAFFGSTPTLGTPAKAGKSLDTSAAFGGVYFQRSDGLYAPPAQTHIAVAEYISESGYYAGYFCTADGSGASASLAIQGTNNGADLLLYPGGNTLSGAGSKVRTGGLVVVGMSADQSGTGTLYVNGVPVASASITPATASTSRLVLLGERSASSGYAVKGRQAQHLFYGRVLSAKEHADIASNHWQVFL